MPTNYNYTFATKQGCRLRDFSFQLVDTETDEPLDVTNCVVKFRMRRPNAAQGDNHILETCLVNDAATGQVTYQWSTTSVGTVGVYDGDFQVVYPDGKCLPVPDGYYFRVIVNP